MNPGYGVSWLSCGLFVAIADPVNISTEIAAAVVRLVHADTDAVTTAAVHQGLALPADQQG